AERRPIAASQRIEAFKRSSRLTAAHERSAPGFAHDELLGFENTQRLAQSAKAHAEFPVQVHFARKKPAGPELAGPYALQHRIANLQVEGSDLKLRIFIHSEVPASILFPKSSRHGCSSPPMHSRPARSPAARGPSYALCTLTCARIPVQKVTRLWYATNRGVCRLAAVASKSLVVRQ